MKQAEIMRQKGYLLAAEVARRCGIDTATVYRWIAEGSVREIRMAGRYHYVDVRSVVAHLGHDAAVALGLIAPTPGAHE